MTDESPTTPGTDLPGEPGANAKPAEPTPGGAPVPGEQPSTWAKPGVAAAAGKPEAPAAAAPGKPEAPAVAAPPRRPGAPGSAAAAGKPEAPAAAAPGKPEAPAVAAPPRRPGAPMGQMTPVLMQRAPATPFNAWPERVWPLDRKSAASGIVLGGAILAGFIGAATVRVTAIGIGFLLLGVAVLAVSLGTRRRWPAPLQGAAAVAVCALLAVGAVRSAGWLFTLCVLAAGVVGTIALVGGRSWTGLLMGVFAPALAQVRTFGWTFRGIGHASESDRSAKTGRMIAVGAVTLALLIVFGGLFASADAVFADLVSGLIPELSVPNLVYRVFLFVVFTGLTLTAAFLAHRPPNFDGLAPGPGRPLPQWEWAVPLAVLDLLFAAFVAVQLTVLFGDRQHVLTTVGLTYADYARQGFWQLLVVTALTLAVIAVAARKVNRERRADRVVARILLGVLCGLALVIVASAMRRMWLYEDEFGFTRLRILVHATELWLGVVFVLIMAAGVALRGRWLPRAVVGTGVLVLLGLAALNPDAYIAEQNIARFERTGKIDVAYLSGLTADAVPALSELDEPRRSCALLEIKVALDEDEPWFQYNWARERARAELAAHPSEHSPTCPERVGW